MNKLATADRVRVISALVEGCSIRSTVRMTGVAKNTIVKLLADLGTACQQYHDENVKDLGTKRIQLDEIWSFCHSKEKNVSPKNWGKMHGDVWTWVALDAEQKLVINWVVGGRDAKYGRAFVEDTAWRLRDHVQITSDGWQVYTDAVKRAFGDGVDYAMLVKQYSNERQGPARYSPPECIGCRIVVKSGNPVEKHISTSYVERQNLTMRMGMRRFTRLTNAFSKKVENHKHAIALHFMHYNFCRVHQTLRVTPAMQAGLADHVWELEELVALLD
jgi:IS1 family transposase